jgi:ATP-dependent Clp protease ATP-binding subunit ClpB
MTSNAGSRWIKEMGAEAARERVMEELDHAFRPEFLNRVDEIILFRSLTKDDLLQIVDIQMRHLRYLLAERQIGLELTDATRQYLADVGYDPVYGARPLKRVIQRQVQDPLALALLQGEFAEGDTVQVDVLDGRIVFQGAAVESVID